MVRIRYFDNIRFLLILAVVIGHIIVKYIYDIEIHRALFLYIYSFHMPMFIFIDGIFHKDKNIKKKILYYTLISFLIKFIIDFKNHNLCIQNIILFNKLDWYVFALAVFILITYLFRKTNKKVVLLLWLFFSFFTAFFPFINYNFSLSRIIMYYPYYLIGNILGEKTIIDKIKKVSLPIKISAIAILIIWGVCIVKFKNLYNLLEIFKGVNDLNVGTPYMCILYKMFCFIISSILIASIMVLMPQKDMKYISVIGQRSMQIYFWHNILKTILKLTYSEWYLSKYWFIIVLMVSIGLTVLSSLKIFGFPTVVLKKIIFCNDYKSC